MCMNDPAFKLLERLCIKFYLQMHRLGLGEPTTLQISFSSHTAFFLFSDKSHTVFKDNVSERIYCHVYIFFVFKKASWGSECVPLEGEREAH